MSAGSCRWLSLPTSTRKRWGGMPGRRHVNVGEKRKRMGQSKTGHWAILPNLQPSSQAVGHDRTIFARARNGVDHVTPISDLCAGSATL